MSIRTLTALMLLALGAAAGTAHAQPACTALGNDPVTGNPLPPPIFITGSTALEPMLKVIGPKIAADQTNGRTLVYLKDGSCGGVARIDTDGLIKQNMLYIPASYDPGTMPSPPTCTVPGTGIPGDLVLSDVDPTLCPGGTKPATVKDFQGPVNNMVFIVPSTSTQTAMSYEMAYLVFGLGASGMVMPWVDPMFYFIRPTDSGTRAMIAASIGTTTHNWQGVFQDPVTLKNFGSGDVVSHVSAQSTTAANEKTIGILGEDFYDSGNNRAAVKALAFRAKNQHYAYWPDSTLSSKDKRNVREGRYFIWGYVHILTAVDGSGVPTSAGAKYFTDLMAGTLSPAPAGFDVIDSTVDSHLVPSCAMKVTRDIEGGPMRPNAPAAPCGCYFDNRATGTAPAGCTACSAASPCATGVCRRGFCEAQ
jgi:hypothetical protein